MKKWYVEFPTYQYNEDVKALAKANKLAIVDSRFQGTAPQCENAPLLTKKGETVEEVTPIMKLRAGKK